MIHPIEPRLWNWSDWARSGQGQARNRCGSAERYYRSNLYESQFSSRCVDIEDAETIERGLTRLPERERSLLVGTYYHRAPPRAIARKLKLGWQGFEQWAIRLRAALALLALRLPEPT